MTGRSRIAKAFSAIRGFTLIELLVVVVIAGIVSSVVLISINVLGDDRDLQREARRLASLVEVAADEAELQGRNFGIEFILGGYRFVEYDPVFDTWTEVVGDDVLRPRSLPDELQFELAVEGRRVELSTRLADTGDPEDDDAQASGSALLRKYAPHAMILSSGDVSPFELTISRPYDGAEASLSVEPSGEILVGDAADAQT